MLLLFMLLLAYFWPKRMQNGKFFLASPWRRAVREVLRCTAHKAGPGTRRGDDGICCTIHKIFRMLGFGGGSRSKVTDVTDITAP